MNPPTPFYVDHPATLNFLKHPYTYSMGQTWTEYFFQDCPPSLVELFRESPQNPDSFKRFECNGSWRLGKPLRTDMPPGHTIMVLPLTVREGNSKDPRYVAKTVSQTTPHKKPKMACLSLQVLRLHHRASRDTH